MSKKLFSLLTILSLATLSGCFKLDPTKKTVAIILPTKKESRVTREGKIVEDKLKELGYNVIVQNAMGEVETQIRQVEDMVSFGVDAMLLYPIDSLALVGVEKVVKNAGIPIVGYDRMLMQTDAISYFCTFDNESVGIQQAQYIIEKAELEKVRQEGGHKTIEFIHGAQEDNNSKFYYEGSMKLLKPYLDDGTLICRTGRTAFVDTVTPSWSQLISQQNMENYLAGFYDDKKLDIVYAAADAVAYGVLSALDSFGFTKDNYPLVTGQDGEIMAGKDIISGKLAMTILKDGRELAKRAAITLDSLLKGQVPEMNNFNDYYNGLANIPTYTCDVQTVDKDNLYEALIESGYYVESDLGL